MKKIIDKLASALTSKKHGALAASLVSIVLSLIVAAILLLALGYNPLAAFKAFLQGAGFLPKAAYGGGTGFLTDLSATINMMGPMLLASLGFIFAFKAGLFNIGISGQMLASGFVAIVVVGYGNMNPWLAKPLVILIGVVVGGLMGAFIGFLKYKFNIHEVVSTIMVNYIISYLTGFFINSYYVNPSTRIMNNAGSAGRLTFVNREIAGMRVDIPLGIILAVIMAFVVKFIIDKTTFGFEIRAVGSNRKAAKYAGMDVGKRMMQSMMISGILAGLAGVCYFYGYYNTIVPKTLPDMGFDSIAVALLGNANPIGAIFSSLLITIFQIGGSYMSSSMGVPKEIGSLMTGILLLFASCTVFFRYLAGRRKEKENEKEAK